MMKRVNGMMHGKRINKPAFRKGFISNFADFVYECVPREVS